MSGETRISHVVVGGGLAGGLAALALADAGRGRHTVLVEKDTTLGGNHTWSFHETDLEPPERALVTPLVSFRWPRQTVRFPGQDRTLEIGYASVTSARFARQVAERLERAGVRLLLGSGVRALCADRVVLDDGTEVRGDVVLDARGPESARQGVAGYQKFLGLEVELEADGPWAHPVVMDACVPQGGGFRFVYVLPFTRRHVLIEDTIYADEPGLDAGALEARVLAYLADHRARVRRVLRREVGVLPLPAADAEPRVSFEAEGALAIGYRGGFFHPVTGYSLPAAARVAGALAKAGSRAEAAAALAALRLASQPQRRFQRLLNRLMFRAMPPERRWAALARFYRLPERTISRFYASRSTPWDRARMLFGRPPRGIAWTRLLGALAEAA